MITFGPVPSRRLGRSLGINNIPPKSCTYSCVYCQLGRSIKMTAEPRFFYKAKDIQNSVRDLNDSEEQMTKIAHYIKQISPDKSYLSIPTRPPAEKWVQPPTEEALICAYHLLNAAIKNVEYLIGYEGNAFAFTGDVKKDLLAITAVHPMREEAVYEFLQKAGADWSTVEKLIKNGLMIKKTFQANTFYARKLFMP